MRVCCSLVLYGPGHTIGNAADVEMAGDLQRFEVDDGNVVIGGAGDEGAVTFGVHEDAGCSMSGLDTLDLFAGVRIIDRQFPRRKTRNKYLCAIGSELEAVRAADACVQCC